jgi:hypothetical protein
MILVKELSVYTFSEKNQVNFLIEINFKMSSKILLRFSLKWVPEEESSTKDLRKFIQFYNKRDLESLVTQLKAKQITQIAF